MPVTPGETYKYQVIIEMYSVESIFRNSLQFATVAMLLTVAKLQLLQLRSAPALLRAFSSIHHWISLWLRGLSSPVGSQQYQHPPSWSIGIYSSSLVRSTHSQVVNMVGCNCKSQVDLPCEKSVNCRTRLKAYNAGGARLGQKMVDHSKKNYGLILLETMYKTDVYIIIFLSDPQSLPNPEFRSWKIWIGGTGFPPIFRISFFHDMKQLYGILWAYLIKVC